ncbi:pilus assembly protein [Pseudomonas sp. FW300-N1A1]|uniref:fimbrial biogenesis chaperone n=1 Tax=Pseudomonas sp. FW300-N1A1 TaxID=2075555 RepID=UPI000CD0CCC6|nr:molecular chaperone [Pseudomonas sp. FW300-N1A1]POA17612.1 pilus assembly protein [Pseudomonas sp. FW300-N1A1]
MPGLFQWLPRARAVSTACALFISTVVYLPVAQAALTLSNTRVVFNGDKRNVALTITNPSDRAFAVQSWVNTEADDQTTAVPFIVSPALFRLNPNKEQQVQINGLPNTLPRDRESLFYFNVQEIPQVQSISDNQLNIALRTRIKFFYRPQELKDNPVERLKDLSWSIEQKEGQAHLRVSNPGPFHVSFIRIEVISNGQAIALDNTAMLAPLSSQHYDLQGVKPGQGMHVTFSTITDYGGFTPPVTQPVSPGF